MVRQCSNTFPSTNIRAILLSVTNFNLFRLDSTALYSAKEDELSKRLTGVAKGARSLKQYESRRYLIVSAGVE